VSEPTKVDKVDTLKRGAFVHLVNLCLLDLEVNEGGSMSLRLVSIFTPSRCSTHPY